VIGAQMRLAPFPGRLYLGFASLVKCASHLDVPMASGEAFGRPHGDVESVGNLRRRRLCRHGEAGRIPHEGKDACRTENGQEIQRGL